MAHPVNSHDIADVLKAWDNAWKSANLVCRYRPNRQKIVEWCSEYPTDLVQEAIEDGMPNFVRRIGARPDDTIRSGNAVFAINYFTGVLRNKFAQLADAPIEEGDHA